MDVNIARWVYDEKIEKVLKILLDPQFKVKNDAYFNLLLTHIRKYQGKDQSNDYLTNIFSSWIIEATKEWKRLKQSVTPDIVGFILNLAALISEVEAGFLKLNSLNVYERLLAIREPSHPTSPIINLGFITLISAFLEHESGLKWVITNNYWINIISITLNSHTVYITSAGCKFLANLLDKIFILNKTYCQNVIKSILDPLDNVTTDKPHINLFPILRLIRDILALLLQRTSIHLLDIFINGFRLNDKLNNLFLLAQTEEFEFEITDIIFILDIVADVKFFSTTEKVNFADVREPRKNRCHDIFKEFIEKGYPKSIIKLFYNYFILWRSIKHKMPKFFYRDQQIKLENQLMIMQLIPIVTAGQKLLGQRNLKVPLESDTVRDDLVNNGLKYICTKTVHMGYIWRNYLLDHKSIEVCTSSLMYVLKSKHFYTREGRIMALHAFIYCLKDILDYVKAGPPNVLLTTQESKFLEMLLEAIAIFIGEFNITWKDSIQCMCVITFTVELINFTIWTPQVVIRALKLLKITINNFIVPSTRLLFDNLYDASFKSLGSLLHNKCQDPFWEVRESAVEVLCTMSCNANNTFPFFKKIVLDAELPQFIVNMAIKDGEPFVRASALRCLQEMIEVKEFWYNLKNIEDIHGHIFNVVLKELEGIVRKEATTLVCKIYINQYYHASLYSNLYDVMQHAAITDLHWEVKVNALKFWKSVIDNHLQHQGMIDGKFPEVTFSKEHRKIVNLNDIEIRKQLVKVLSQLSEIGCLAIFIKALQNDFDSEVSKSAAINISEFVSLLKRYDIDAQDADLRPKSFNSAVSGEFSLITKHNALHKKTVVPPSDFIKFTYNNLKVLEKNDWSNGVGDLESLLDKILND